LNQNFLGHVSVPSRYAVRRHDSSRPEIARRDLPGAAGPTSAPGAAAPLSAGNLVYLASVGLVATTVIGVFFGIGFSLLLPPADRTTPISDTRQRVGQIQSLASVLPRPDANGDRSPDGKVEPAARGTGFALSGGAAPSLVAPLPPRRSTDGPPQGEGGARENSATLSAAVNPPQGAPKQTFSPAGVEAARSPAKVAQGTPATVAAGPAPNAGLSDIEIAELLTRGDARLRTGDVASARLFYERAAAAGDGRAALRLGATFDPAYLGRAGLGNVQGDAAEARSWYSRALDLGATEANHQ
jgi:hypothetical protein